MPQQASLTQSRVFSRLTAFFIPMLFTNLLQQAYTFVDSVIVGKGLGDQALGSVGNLSSVTFLFTGFLTGIAIGFSVNIAQSYGAGDEHMFQKFIAHSIKLCAMITAVLTVISLFLLKPLLHLMQTSPLLMKDSLIYGYFFFSSLMVIVAYNLCSGILRAVGDSKTPLKAIIVASIANIVLDCLLIFAFHAGVAGAAIATIAAQLLSVWVCLRKLLQSSLMHLGREDFAADRRADFELMKNGLPTALMNSITAVGCMVVQGSINAAGAAFTTAYSAGSKYLSLFMLPSITAGYALSAFVSQNKGAGQIRRIHEGARWGVAIAVCSWLLVGGPMICLPEKLASVMLSDPATIELTAGFMRICGVSLIFLNLLFIFRNAVQGLGRPLIPMISGIAEMLLRIPVITLLIPRIGFRAAAYAESAAWLGAFALNAAAWAAFILQERRIRPPVSE